MTTQEQAFWKASEQFVEEAKTNQDIIGIIICGSLVNGVLHKNSDIDIVLISKPSCDYRERGNTWIKGIEIEYFMNPPQQIRKYFELEMNSPHTANMLATGKLVFQKDEAVQQLIIEAKEILQQGPSEIKVFEIELAKYFLDDKLKDFDDIINTQDETAKQLIKFEILNFCINTFCKKHKIWRAKDKNLQKQLAQIDQRFADLLNLGITQKWEPDFFQNYKKELTRSLFGPREKEWKLRSALGL